MPEIEQTLSAIVAKICVASSNAPVRLCHSLSTVELLQHSKGRFNLCLSNLPTLGQRMRSLPMATVYFITHPEVMIDPSVSVTDWPLSARGIQRITLMFSQPWISRIATIFSSAERKAIEVAHMLDCHLSLKPTIIGALGENDRSSTGYLPKAEFEAVADQFFANPNESVRGWERAVDAQTRIVSAVHRAIAAAGTGKDIVTVSHGAVGALLLCHLKDAPISRAQDQPAGGGGNFFRFDAATYQLISEWRRIDD